MINLNSKYIPYTQIMCNLPICKGDILYVVSDILGIAKACKENGEKFECEKFIESLQKAVGKEGTLLFPTFNFNFCKEQSFDYIKTKGVVGALGNSALKMQEFKRTQHPIYSFAVWGKAQNELINLKNKSCFGDGSPLEFMYKNNAKAFVVGLEGLKSVSFYHYVEEMLKVDYRYYKDFTAPYTDSDGKTEDRTYSMYVRDLDINPIHSSFEELNIILAYLNISKKYEVNRIPFHFVDLIGMFEVISLEIRYNNANNLYIFQNR